MVNSGLLILRLSGFNSAFVSSSADKKGDLFIDPACMQLVRDRGVEHLVMCHHPYDWRILAVGRTPSRPSSNIRHGGIARMGYPVAKGAENFIS
jgi:hypothetical protein